MSETRKNDTGKQEVEKHEDKMHDGEHTHEQGKAGHGENVVVAEPGSAGAAKSGDSAGVDTKEVVGAQNYFRPPSADKYNLEHRVSDSDPNYLEAARKLDPENVPETGGAADIAPKQA